MHQIKEINGIDGYLWKPWQLYLVFSNLDVRINIGTLVHTTSYHTIFAPLEGGYKNQPNYKCTLCYMLGNSPTQNQVEIELKYK